MSGTEMQRAKESAAEIMRQKQAAVTRLDAGGSWWDGGVLVRAWDADDARAAEARKTAEGAGGSKKK
ncbi:hypothetical protein ColLi_05350 [Colletotrichum liriopes]|uniref:Uncharacterized protein n=1 Tax=Colletotrichum liriopes TaxID=708192 RepID=A0AA37LS91_9PEZI|nr:hypothetical protein ColLi_05350 [Colletotrichum liriopes]